nr:carboxypeptidase-like regulatory domain-containing protein [Flavobacterium sp.]
MKKKFVLFIILLVHFGYSQEKTSLSGIISSDKKRVAEARVFLIGTKYATQTDSLGKYSIDTIAEGNYKVQIAAAGFQSLKKSITVKNNENNILDFEL